MNDETKVVSYTTKPTTKTDAERTARNLAKQMGLRKLDVFPERQEQERTGA